MLIKAEFEQRLSELRKRMLSEDRQALLVFSLDNLRYLTNYSGEAAYGIVTLEKVFLITDYRFMEQAKEECFDCHLKCRDRDQQSLGQAIRQVLDAQGITRLLFEAAHINTQVWAGIVQELNGIIYTASAGLAEDLRKTKDEWEIAQIRKAAAIADQALQDSLPLIKPGISERAFALELEYRMQQLGSEGLSFPSIVGFGPRSALPHCIPSSRALAEGNLIVIDFGAVINGYRSDMTRSFVAGKANAQQRNIFDTVQRAQQAALDSLHAGQIATAVSAAASNVLQASEFASHTSTGLGHGVGIQLHEQPFISPVCHDTLQTNYVITIEPGIYIPGYGGVRIEDDVVVLADGYSFISHAPKLFELEI
ncbi:M24 family metallopeptidase [Undibacterium sp. Ji42W]|uniref:M24 family metallopeptidase n=1 Tax=Undibacterium sp. Ji42W TaxID=3413039 RepID=UPI003BF39318